MRFLLPFCLVLTCCLFRSYGSSSIHQSRTLQEIFNADVSESNNAVPIQIDQQTNAEENLEITEGADKDNNIIRTATGGLINQIMVVLTFVAFIGNGAFVIYVFWLSK